MMRLPTLDDDGWTLRSAEASHRAHPQTFWIPPLDARRNLQRGNAARLVFDIETVDDNDGGHVIQGERMWVIVLDRVGDLYIRILDNQPASVGPNDRAYLCFGAEIPFGPEHVVDIGEPPPEYVAWQLGQKAERIWPRQ